MSGLNYARGVQGGVYTSSVEVQLCRPWQPSLVSGPCSAGSLKIVVYSLSVCVCECVHSVLSQLCLQGSRVTVRFAGASRSKPLLSCEQSTKPPIPHLFSPITPIFKLPAHSPHIQTHSQSISLNLFYKLILLNVLLKWSSSHFYICYQKMTSSNRRKEICICNSHLACSDS